MAALRVILKTRQTGRTCGITLPALLRRPLGWEKGDYVVAELDAAREAIVITRWKGQASAVAVEEPR